MPLPGSLHRRVAGLALVVSMVLPGAAAQPASERGRLGPLREWLDVVERHEPGDVDAALVRAAGWSSGDLDMIYSSAAALFIVIRQPTTRRIRSATPPQPGSSVQPASIVFDGAVLNELKDLAKVLESRGVDALIQRGALLHTDLVTLSGHDEPLASAPSDSRPAPQRFHVDDGRLDGVSTPPVHWDIARMLVANATRGGPAEAWIRDWYRATVAFLLREQQLGTEHVRVAQQVEAADPLVLMLAGAEHESLASSLVQVFIHNQVLPPRTHLRVEPEGREWAAAQGLFERALAAQTDLVEARVRLGRVLGLRGRHDEAVLQLRMATGGARDPLLAYYAWLFLGAELEALGEDADATLAYTNAAAGFPDARSPNLALARLAWRSANEAELASRLARSLSGDDEDPWAIYYQAAGRDADAMIDAVRAPFRRGAR